MNIIRLKRFGQGVILGDEDTPMRNVVFDGVRVVNAQVGDQFLFFRFESSLI